MPKKTPERLTVQPLDSFAEPLLRWFYANSREMPWRSDPTPYHVLLSEIMLQQTRVDTVRAYYARFLETFPTVESLAAADEQQVLKLWEGLGYYSRARNLLSAARRISENGFPDTFEGLLKLPGIGRYTAGAIASIAFGVRVPCVDGNVLRVLTRFCSDDLCIDEPSARTWAEAKMMTCLPEERPGDLNQAVMELGALVCLPGGEPHCVLCPLAESCRGKQNGTASDLPVRAEKAEKKQLEYTVFLLVCGNRVALRKRPRSGVLAGMWEYPNAEGRLSAGEAALWLTENGVKPTDLLPLPEATHVFTHLEWFLSGFLAEVCEMSDRFEWVEYPELLRSYPIPAAFRAYSDELSARWNSVG